MGSCNCAIAAINIPVSKSQQRLITTSTLYLSRWWAPRPGQSVIGLGTKALKWRLHSQAMGPVFPHGFHLGQGQNCRCSRRAGDPSGSRQLPEPLIRWSYSVQRQLRRLICFFFHGASRWIINEGRPHLVYLTYEYHVI